MDGLFEGMEVSLIVLLRLADDFDLDVLEGKHADHLSPAAHAAAEEISCEVHYAGHLEARSIKKYQESINFSLVLR